MKILGSLCLFERDKSSSDNKFIIIDFTDNNTTDSFEFKEKITGQIRNDDTKNVKFLENPWNTIN